MNKFRKKPKRETKHAREVRLLKAKAWDLQREYLLKRDDGCVTCGKSKHAGIMHAGHFEHQYLDFCPLNIHLQCVRCNKNLHGNLGQYSRFLHSRYGYGIVEAIKEMRMAEERMTKKARYTPELLEKIINYYQTKIELL